MEDPPKAVEGDADMNSDSQGTLPSTLELVGWYLHRKNVCHRDLKLENLLLDRKDRKGRIKVTDFGLSKESSEKSILETYVGTPIYIAPEIISSAKTGKSYDLKSDCWSLGVILYTLLSATPPFNQDLEEKFLNKLILSGRYCKMKGEAWDKVSPEGKDLVASLLTVDPKERPSATEILDHKWFSNDEVLCAEAKEMLFSKTGSNAAELCVSVKTISNNLEGLSVGQQGTGDKVERKEGSGVKRAEPSSVDCHEINGNKRQRVEVEEEVILVEDSD